MEVKPTTLAVVTGLKMPSAVLFAAAGTEALQNVSTLDPASSSAESIRLLFIILTAVCAFILLVVWGVLFYSLIRFRRRRDGRSESGQPINQSEPPQVYGSMPIEIAWTVAPTLIVFLLLLVIVRTELDVRISPLRDPSAPSALRVTVVGHQWWWEYIVTDDQGRNLNMVTANELHIPASEPGAAASAGESAMVTPVSFTGARPTFLTLLSADVCHSFWVPRLAGKTDLIPGKENQAWLQTSEPGLYLGQCAEYCGSQHANMLLRVYVDPPADFAAWLTNEEKPAIDDPLVRDGRQMFLSQSCVNCHTIRGTPAQGKFGPDLTHLAARKTIAGGMIELTRANLRNWIRDPQQIKVDCLMPAFGLSDQNVDLITDYLMTLK